MPASPTGGADRGLPARPARPTTRPRDREADQDAMDDRPTRTAEAPEALLARLAAAARRLETPCGEGSMVWHVWGDGAPLVLLHGGSGSWRHWARNVGPLSEHRMVVCPDLPGLGESAMPPPAEDPGPVAAVVREGITHLLG